jgi:hypothetical protein
MLLTQSKYFILFILIFFQLQVNLCACNDKTIPQVPWLDTNNLLYFSISNDGFGYDLGEECDDYRTFGFSLGYFSVLNFFLSADIFSLTNRNSDVEYASRTDEVRLLAGYTFLSFYHHIFFIRISAGAGILTFGNFGTGGLQSFYHNLFHFDEPRPLPQTYDNAQTAVPLFLRIDTGENLTGGFNLKVYTHITHLLDYAVDITLGYWIPKNVMQFFYAASYIHTTASAYPPSARKTSLAENGLWLCSKAFIGPLFIERSVNIFTLTPAGSIGLRINNLNPSKNPHNIRFDYSLGGVFGFISNIEILRIHPLPFFPRLSAYHWIQKHEDFDTYQKMLRLHIQSIGIDLSLFNPEERTFVNPFAYIGYGFVSERYVTNDRFHDRIIDRRLMQIMHFGLGGRLKISDFFHESDCEYGLEAAWDLRFSYGDSIYSNAQSTSRYGFYVSEK